MNSIVLAGLLKTILEENPGTKVFHVTTDFKVFLKPSLAVAHAVALSPGNPIVHDFPLEHVETLIEAHDTLMEEMGTPGLSDAGELLDVLNGVEAITAPAADDEPVVDAPVVDAPAVDAPTVDAPAIDAPVVDALVVDAPAVDAPVVEAPPVPVVNAPAPAKKKTATKKAAPTKKGK